MPHVIHGDTFALQRYAWAAVPGAVVVPPVFECEECEDVRQTVASWQERTQQQRDDSEDEGQVHVVEIGFL